MIWALTNFLFLNNMQGVSEASKLSNHHQLQRTHGDQNPMSSELKYNYQMATDGQIPQREYMDVHIIRDTQPDSVNPSVAGEPQVSLPS